MMENNTLQTILHSLIGNEFAFVFSNGTENIKMKKGKYFVYNTAKPPKMGHFIAIYFNKQGMMEIFDSFGYKYMNIPKYIAKQATKIKIVSRKQLQSKYSHICALYVIYYIYYRSNGLTISEILKNFTKNVDSNDTLIFYWYKKTIISSNNLKV